MRSQGLHAAGIKKTAPKRAAKTFFQGQLLDGFYPKDFELDLSGFGFLSVFWILSVFLDPGFGFASLDRTLMVLPDLDLSTLFQRFWTGFLRIWIFGSFGYWIVIVSDTKMLNFEGVWKLIRLTARFARRKEDLPDERNCIIQISGDRSADGDMTGHFFGRDENEKPP